LDDPSIEPEEKQMAEVVTEYDVKDDGIQHGIDDDPNHDVEKGAILGGVGGAAVGAIAGSAIGPVGAVIGGVIGGVAGAIGSGAAVGALDNVDNDDTLTGLGDDATVDLDDDDDIEYVGTTVPIHTWAGDGTPNSGSNIGKP
jgi:hypothetical protein